MEPLLFPHADSAPISKSAQVNSDSDSFCGDEIYNEARTAALHNLPHLPKQRPRCLTPFGSRKADSKDEPEALFQECTFFKIPPDIRNLILTMAFGDRRVHMDLAFRHPDVTLPSGPFRAHHHYGIDEDASRHLEEEMYDSGQPPTWQWWSSVCHRLPPDHDSTLTGPMTNGGPDGPWGDTCRVGKADHCQSWKGDIPFRCRIGIMGWLLSCRQNYAEGIDALYSTNIIAMTGETLICHLPDLLLPQRLVALPSLEISWTLDEPDIEDPVFVCAEARLENMLQILSSNFPRLRHLYVSLQYSNCYSSHRWTWVRDHLDQFARRTLSLSECAFSLPTIDFQKALESANIITEGGSSQDISSYQQIWRSLDGGISAVQLPYLDSYPNPPYHLGQAGTENKGYWILHGENEVYESGEQGIYTDFESASADGDSDA
ncbi:hypothetical protein FZEAL_1681 [Fusarium zealandicum]|uniref:DUF7730 domain-containing protein n=1 Tax=Fusarium zealandicum TaxID=1053134 RepID=A0A8H4XPA3_9HYPO|nr:hypothetical protein FZEAL_1681 [Fusarium zealandicum]